MALDKTIGQALIAARDLSAVLPRIADELAQLATHNPALSAELSDLPAQLRDFAERARGVSSSLIEILPAPWRQTAERELHRPKRGRRSGQRKAMR